MDKVQLRSEALESIYEEFARLVTHCGVSHYSFGASNHRTQWLLSLCPRQRGRFTSILATNLAEGLAMHQAFTCQGRSSFF